MENLQQLYEQDFNLWLEQIAIAIKHKDVEAMDWDNLLEEIEDMGASQKRALDSYLQRLIEHILKLKYWESEVERCRIGWKQEVTNFRNRINRILKKNPSLRNYLASEYQDIYQDAIKVMKFQFVIPEDSLIELDRLMDENYFG
jgi:hypothetical protein